MATRSVISVLTLFFAGSILRLAAVLRWGAVSVGWSPFNRITSLDGWPLSLYPASELHWATGFKDWLHPDLPQRSWAGSIHSFVLLLVSRMNDEEKFLESYFGDEYRNYRLRTRRLVPFVINGAKCVSVKSHAESVGSICVQTCRGCKYGLIAIERMKRVASEFERDSHVEDID